MRTTFALMSAAAIASGLLAGAAGSVQAATPTIGVTMAYFDDNFLTKVRGAITDEAKAKGAHVQFEDAQGDIGRQLSQIQNFIAQHVSAIILNVVDTSATPKMTRLATAAGIPLVYVNREPEVKTLPDKVAFVGSDEHQAGKLEGDATVKFLGGHGNVAIMQGELSNQSTHLRSEGVENAAKATGGAVKIIAEQPADWHRSKAIDLMNNWIVSGLKINAVAANNDEMAIGAILALRQAHLDPKNYVITGVDGTADGLAEIAKGNLKATVFQDARGQGKGAVDAALDLAAGKPVDKIIFVPFQLVTKDNYKDFLNR